MARGDSGLRRAATLGAVALGLAAALAGPRSHARGPAGGPRRAPGGGRLELAPPLGTAGFARAESPRRFQLPEDHGPHFEFQTEWWYYTGQLAAADGARYGFQLTFFRRGLTPGPPPAGPGLATNQVYFAHLALTDVAGGRHVAAERFARGAGGLAGATAAPYAVWLEDWRAEALAGDGSQLRLRARDAASGLFLDLVLEATKPLVAHGDHGLSAKSGERGNASYYIGYTRLAAHGTVGVGPHRVEASGQAWFDHEWSTSALGAGAVGWDWFSLQLDDGRDLMCFRVRRTDGGADEASSGTLVAADGAARGLGRDEFSIAPLRRWTSPRTGTTYPSRWRVSVPGEGLDVVVDPLLDDQEMRTSFVYWEGAVAVRGTAAGRAVRGHGYVELTGYGTSMRGVF
jgi:predicted secreted hydrolase